MQHGSTYGCDPHIFGPASTVQTVKYVDEKKFPENI